MGAESRRMPRRTVTGLIEVVDVMTEETIGHLGNLSVGGMLLMGWNVLKTLSDGRKPAAAPAATLARA